MLPKSTLFNPEAERSAIDLMMAQSDGQRLDLYLELLALIGS